jgi:hypothetical protein
MFIDTYLKLFKILHHVFLEIRNDSDSVIDDDTTSVKIISPLKSTSNI